MLNHAMAKCLVKTCCAMQGVARDVINTNNLLNTKHHINFLCLFM